VKTPYEVGRIRGACRIAEKAFAFGLRQLRPGLKETEAAQHFRSQLSIEGVGADDIVRADGFTFCMSGANSANAFGAFARSQARQIELGDLALVHCNSYADGYWTDVTRTYSVGAVNDRSDR